MAEGALAVHLGRRDVNNQFAQAYGSVAPNAALRSAGETAQRQNKSNGNTFMAIVAGVLVLGGCVHAGSVPRVGDGVCLAWVGMGCA